MINNYLVFYSMNPFIFKLGKLYFRWYGFMYIIGFIFSLWLVKKKKKNMKIMFISNKDLENLIYYIFLGIFIGGRVGYVLIYKIENFLNNLFYIFKIWYGGMSFHGGLIGTVLTIKLFIINKKSINFYKITDFISTIIPLCIGIGRLGNFINGELYGIVSVKLPIIILFQNSLKDDIKFISENKKLKSIFNKYGRLPRHPSQLYESLLEGVILFIIINFFIKKKRPIGSISGLFLILYGFFRFLLEYFRQPDHKLILLNYFTIGQILSIPMLLLGCYLINNAYKNKL
ncbi:MAG: prolipoprotein diacylglyceryl transferase [Candidatus Makana argininalis]